MGAKATIDIIEGYPSLYNHPERAEVAMHILQTTLGKEHVKILPKRMTTEDFARYSQVIPSTFFRLGVKGKFPCGKLHTPEFFADPDALVYGIQNLCSLVIYSQTDITNL